VKSIGKPRDAVSEHMAGARKAMQQQQCLRLRRPRFAIENIEALDIGLPKADFARRDNALTAFTIPSASKIDGPSSHLRKSALGMR
jgi:hypothetical protein